MYGFEFDDLRTSPIRIVWSARRQRIFGTCDLDNVSVSAYCRFRWFRTITFYVSDEISLLILVCCYIPLKGTAVMNWHFPYSKWRWIYYTMYHVPSSINVWFFMKAKHHTRMESAYRTKLKKNIGIQHLGLIFLFWRWFAMKVWQRHSFEGARCLFIYDEVLSLTIR